MNSGLLPKLGHRPIQGYELCRFGASVHTLSGQKTSDRGAQTTNLRWRSWHLKAVQLVGLQVGLQVNYQFGFKLDLQMGLQVTIRFTNKSSK